MNPEQALEYLHRGGKIVPKTDKPFKCYFQMFQHDIIMRVTPVTSCAAEVRPELMFRNKESWDYFAKYNEWLPLDEGNS